jgi:hypothetical protein
LTETKNRLSGYSDFVVAIAAIYWLAAPGLEWYLGMLATLRTCGREKLALLIGAVTATYAHIFIKYDFPGCPTPGTTLRLIG